MGAEGIRVEIRRKPDRALVAATQNWQGRAIAAALALPLLFLALRAALQPVIRSFKEDPVGETIIIVICVAVTVVVLARTFRRNMRPPQLPGQLWCSPPAVCPGAYQKGADGFEVPPEVAEGLVEENLPEGGPVPVVRLVLTAERFLMVPLDGKAPPRRMKLSDIDTIGVTWCGRRENGVTITRRDGREAAFLFKPDQKLVDELERLGATVVNQTGPTGGL